MIIYFILLPIVTKTNFTIFNDRIYLNIIRKTFIICTHFVKISLILYACKKTCKINQPYCHTRAAIVTRKLLIELYRQQFLLKVNQSSIVIIPLKKG